MTELIRTKQGPFDLQDCLYRENWNNEKISEAILKCSDKIGLKFN